MRWTYKGNVRRSLVTRHHHRHTDRHSLELFCCFNGKRNEGECDQRLKHSATHVLNNNNNNNMIVWSMILCLIILLTINYNVIIVVIVDFGCNRRHTRLEQKTWSTWKVIEMIFYIYFILSDYSNAEIVNGHVGNCRPRHLNTCRRYNPKIRFWNE